MDNQEYYERIQKINFSCDMVLSLKKIFFGTGLNVFVEDEVLRHLLTCKKCRTAYTEYAKEVGYKKFNIINYSIQFVENNKDFKASKTREYLSEVKGNKKFRVLSRPWTRAANNFDIYKLMSLKAFRDLSLEYNSPTGMDYSDFVKYMSLKIAKRIDHLEECLIKTEELEKEEQNAESK